MSVPRHAVRIGLATAALTFFFQERASVHEQRVEAANVERVSVPFVE